MRHRSVTNQRGKKFKLKKGSQPASFANPHRCQDPLEVMNMEIEQAWKTWSDCLQGDDENSIFNQIHLMIWDTMIFRIIFEGRQIQLEKNPDNPAINGHCIHLSIGII
jgi:hypothetical protein